MAQDDCHKSGYPSGRITDKMVCAGLPKGLKDACQVSAARSCALGCVPAGGGQRGWLRRALGCLPTRRSAKPPASTNQPCVPFVFQGDSGGPLVLAAESGPSSEVIGTYRSRVASIPALSSPLTARRSRCRHCVLGPRLCPPQLPRRVHARAQVPALDQREAGGHLHLQARCVMPVYPTSASTHLARGSRVISVRCHSLPLP